MRADLIDLKFFREQVGDTIMYTLTKLTAFGYVTATKSLPHPREVDFPTLDGAIFTELSAQVCREESMRINEVGLVA